MADILTEEVIDEALRKHGFLQVEEVGVGSFGTALLVERVRAVDSTDAERAVVKMINVQSASEKEKQDALNESKVLASLQHPYIVRYQESFQERGCLWIVMDYCLGGTLCEYIKTASPLDELFPENQVLRWFTQEALALQYLHEHKILHRDLKSNNFFLEHDGSIKMGDFGLSKVLECTAQLAHTKVGTPSYMPPEIVHGRPYAWSCDIWSLGCVLFEMCARHMPFQHQELKKLVQRICRGPIPDLPAEYSEGLRQICKKMLGRDPGMRPSAEKILSHPDINYLVHKLLDQKRASGDTEGTRALSSQLLLTGDSSEWTAKPKQDCAYKVGDEVEYMSDRHRAWVPAVVTKIDSSGNVTLDVKPKVALPPPVQAAKVRVRQTLAPVPPPAMALSEEVLSMSPSRRKLPHGMSGAYATFERTTASAVGAKPPSPIPLSPADTRTMMSRVLGGDAARQDWKADRLTESKASNPQHQLAQTGPRMAMSNQAIGLRAASAATASPPPLRMLGERASSAAQPSRTLATSGGSVVGFPAFRRVQSEGLLSSGAA